MQLTLGRHSGGPTAIPPTRRGHLLRPRSSRTNCSALLVGSALLTSSIREPYVWKSGHPIPRHNHGSDPLCLAMRCGDIRHMLTSIVEVLWTVRQVRAGLDVALASPPVLSNHLLPRRPRHGHVGGGAAKTTWAIADERYETLRPTSAPPVPELRGASDLAHRALHRF